MNMNLCLICCYSIQVKPNRFISNDTRQNFHEFSKELGFILEGGGDGGDLRLPFGESITVCGDCLSLVDVYVQRRRVQRDKEETLLELQRRVVKLTSELTAVIEDVQGHIDRLHGSVRMGDGGILGGFIGGGDPHLESQAKSFRERVLSLNTSAEQFRTPEVTNQCPPSRSPANQSVLVKSEPAHLPGIGDPSDADTNSNDAFFEPDDLAQVEIHVSRGPVFPSSSDPSHCIPVPSSSSVSTYSRNCRGSTAAKRELDESWLQDLSDSDDDGWEPKNKRRKKVSSKTEADSSSKKAPKLGGVLTPGEAAKWKQDLWSRVAAMPQIFEPVNATEAAAGTPEMEETGAPSTAPTFFQIINDKLHLRGIDVVVRDKRRMLECLRCQKMFFEARDVISPDCPVEILMRDHILDKHCGPPKKKPPPPPVEHLDIIEYTSSTTKNKITFKIADNNRYAYRKACAIKGASYFQCDYRLGRCNAYVLHKNGRYSKLKKGWTPDGFHELHGPDEERVNREITLGKAKELYLKDPSKTIDDVCSIVMSESEAVPLKHLKRRLRRAKYGTSSLAPEERVKPPQQCYHCGKVYKEGRNLLQHLSTVHGETNN